MSYRQQLHVVFDLKTPKSLPENQTRWQHVVEQLASARVSQHPVMTVFSDQSLVRMSLFRNTELIMTEEPVALEVAAQIMMKNFLSEASCVSAFTLPSIEETKENPYFAGLQIVKNSAPEISENVLP